MKKVMYENTHTMNQFYLSFNKRLQHNENTFSFYFKRQGNFNYSAGQYIRLILPHNNPDDRGTTRFFTIASSPHESEYLMITVKILESTFKKALFGLIKDQKVQIFGPMGNFVLDESEKEDAVFLAGGMGITPFRSMIAYAYAKKLKKKMTLFASFQRIEEFIFYEELLQISDVSKYIQTNYIVSNPDFFRGWDGEIGRISHALLKKYVEPEKVNRYYITGPPVMVDSLMKMLNELNIESERIITEKFTGY